MCHCGTQMYFLLQAYLLERDINLNALGIKSMRGQGRVLQFKLHLPTPILVLPFSLWPDINLAGRQINWSMQILPITATPYCPPRYKTQRHNLCVCALRRHLLAHFGVCFAVPPGQSAAGAGLSHHSQREPVGRGDVPVRGGEQARRHLRQCRAQCHR